MNEKKAKDRGEKLPEEERYNFIILAPCPIALCPRGSPLGDPAGVQNMWQPGSRAARHFFFGRHFFMKRCKFVLLDHCSFTFLL